MTSYQLDHAEESIPQMCGGAIDVCGAFFLNDPNGAFPLLGVSHLLRPSARSDPAGSIRASPLVHIDLYISVAHIAHFRAAPESARPH